MAECVLLKNRNVGTAVFFGVAGAFEDGWCGPSVTFKIGVNARTSLLDMRLWLPAREEGQTSRFIVQIANRASKTFTLHHGSRFHLQCDCRALPGEIVDVELRSDHVVTAVRDLRTLAFRLFDVSLA